MRAAAVALAAAAAFGAHAQVGDAYAQTVAQTSRPLLPRDGPDAANFRGSLVFLNYCVTCHGPNADGKGRALGARSSCRRGARLINDRITRWPVRLRPGAQREEKAGEATTYSRSPADRVTK